MKNFLKEFIFIVSLLIIIVAVFSFFVKPTSPEGNSLTLSSLQKPKEISLSQLVQDVNKGEVEKIEISGTSITISYKNNKKAVDDYLHNQKNALNFLIGQVMKQSDKRADFKQVKEILEKMLK